MEVFNVQSFSIRAGSMMYFVQNKKGGKRQISSRVEELLRQEKKEKETKRGNEKLMARNCAMLFAAMQKVKHY